MDWKRSESKGVSASGRDSAANPLTPLANATRNLKVPSTLLAGSSDMALSLWLDGSGGVHPLWTPAVRVDGRGKRRSFALSR
jgi:hypothetical protein